jgi:hypothetical protein
MLGTYTHDHGLKAHLGTLHTRTKKYRWNRKNFALITLPFLEITYHFGLDQLPR